MGAVGAIVPAGAAALVLLVSCRSSGSEDVQLSAGLQQYEAGELGGERPVETYVVVVRDHSWYECYGWGGARIDPPRPPQLVGRFTVTQGRPDGPWGPNDRATFSVDGLPAITLFPWPTPCSTQ